MENSEYKLDELDHRILQEMERDGRQSVSDLARKLGTSRAYASRRLQRLLDRKITRIAAFTNPFVLGYRVFAIMGVRVLPSAIHTVADQLGTMANVHLVITAAGRNDILLWTMFQTQAELSHFLGRGIGAVPDITSVETMIVLEIQKISFSSPGPLNDASKEASPPPPPLIHGIPEIDQVDLMILREMERDGRQSVSDLAKKIGASRAYTATKLQRLLERQCIRIMAFTNPLYLGYRMFAMLGIKVAPGQIDVASERLSALAEVQTVVRVTGRYDLIVSTMFRTPPDLSNFLVQEIGSIPGIVSLETNIGLGLRKISLHYLASSYTGEVKARVK